ncbi:hypothetical protein ACFQMM_13130 [Saliphagus sp. GCM10025308]
MAYGLAEGEEVEIEGLRETTVDGVPRTLVVGETVTFPVAVDNRGDRDGPYRATVLVDDAIAAEATGRLGSARRPSNACRGRPSQPVGTRSTSVTTRSSWTSSTPPTSR